MFADSTFLHPRMQSFCPSTRRRVSRPRAANIQPNRCDPGNPHDESSSMSATAPLVAAMDVATGKVMATDIEHNNSVTFIAFLEEIESSIEDSLAIHIVMDNGSSHTSKATRAWLADHPRFVVHHTPAHASWLNQVEAFFSILTRKLLRRGEFESRQDLVDKMLTFIDHHSTTAEPFKWSYDAKRVAA